MSPKHIIPLGSGERLRELEQYIAKAKEQYKEATEDFYKAMEKNPRLTEAYHDRGRTNYKLGQYREATHDFYRYMRKRLQNLIKQ